MTQDPATCAATHAALYLGLLMTAGCVDSSPRTSSSSSWLLCDTARDCEMDGIPPNCEEGYCVDPAGARIAAPMECAETFAAPIDPFDTCDTLSSEWTVYGDASLCECVQHCEGNEECAEYQVFDYNPDERSCIVDATCVSTGRGYIAYAFGDSLPDSDGDGIPNVAEVDESRDEGSQGREGTDSYCEDYCRMEAQCLIVSTQDGPDDCYSDCVRWKAGHRGCGFDDWLGCVGVLSCEDAVEFFIAHPDGVGPQTPCAYEYEQMSCLDFEPRQEYDYPGN